MNKLDKKKAKLKERIEVLEDELYTSLHKKDGSVEINVPLQVEKINRLKKELISL